MNVEKRLELVHFQITKSCNLRCWFCGQWGNKGFFSDTKGTPMKYADWEKVIDTLSNYREISGISPSIMLWGGEPLISPDFERIVKQLRSRKFELGIVTNGVFIDKWADVLRNDFKKIHISIDGPRDIHDEIRGKGIYDKVIKNAKMLIGGKSDVIVMSVKSDKLSARIDEFADCLEQIQPTELYLQDMIAMNDEETSSYANWFKNCFGREASDIYSWKNSYIPSNAAFKIPCGHSFEIVQKRHGISDAFCLSPFRHAHIAWNGEVMYCTDFYDFSAGNVKENNLIDIFNNELSEKFRSEIKSGSCVTCRHCSWKNDKCFSL